MIHGTFSWPILARRLSHRTYNVSGRIRVLVRGVASELEPLVETVNPTRTSPTLSTPARDGFRELVESIFLNLFHRWVECHCLNIIIKKRFNKEDREYHRKEKLARMKLRCISLLKREKEYQADKISGWQQTSCSIFVYFKSRHYINCFLSDVKWNLWLFDVT